MNNGKCIYFVEGSCEQQLIRAFREKPEKIIPGKIKVFNVIQKLLPKSQLLSIQPGTKVAFVFDTDIEVTAHLQRNMELIRKYCGGVRIVFLPQVLNLEDELVRCTDVKKAWELTKSSGTNKFKTDFCRMKPAECRRLLERHGMEIEKLWQTKAPAAFAFIEENAKLIRVQE